MTKGMVEVAAVVVLSGGCAGLAGLATVAIPVALGRVGAGKLALDYLLGSILLVLSLPLLAVCAAIIRLSSPGPVLLRQTRIGCGGHTFEMLKLRTMYQDAEARTGPVWAADNDPRVVPACRWMRLTHVDELPQLVNVLRGEMSLVGPRPERPEILASLRRWYPHLADRHTVRPGITGLAQVRWSYDTTPERFGRKLDADLEYIESHNLLVDLWILLVTLPRCIDTRGAR